MNIFNDIGSVLFLWAFPKSVLRTTLGAGFPLILLSASGGCGVSAAIPNAAYRYVEHLSDKLSYKNTTL